jgi:septal ring factor EnvC (AmiA/AmiB activator)
VCVGWDQLEKALKEMQTEGLEVETAERQLSQAKEMLASVEEKSSQVDIQLAKVQGEHTQANYKLVESQLQLQEVEAREDALRREHCSLMSEYVHGCVLLCIE